MKTSVLTTVYNRDERVLWNTLYTLRRNNLQDTEIIIVDDGSTQKYDKVENYCLNYELPVRWIRVDTIRDRPGTYNIDGYNNPSYAWNTAFEAAAGDQIVMLSSDCMISPHTLDYAAQCKKRIWMAEVTDMETGTTFFGRARPYPMGWVTSWYRDVVGDIREDENYLKGIGYEDNDFTMRLALAAGSIEIEPAATAFHQSHEQIAYSDGHLGMDINEKYTMEKWGGIPWLQDGVDGVEVRIGDSRGKWYLHAKHVGADAEVLCEQHGVA